MYVIPVTSEPNQRFRCLVPVDNANRAFTFEFSFNAIAEYWEMSVVDDDTNEPLATAVPLLPGAWPAANLLEQYAHLEIGVAVVVGLDTTAPGQTPDDTNLGAEFFLVWGDNL